jgi:hypothetical protein
MKAKRRIEIFSAGCPTCEDNIQQIQAAACPSCEIEVLDMRENAIAIRAQRLGIRSLPAVVIDGMLAACCAGRGPDIATLQAAGLGRA